MPTKLNKITQYLKTTKTKNKTLLDTWKHKKESDCLNLQLL